MFGYKLFKRMLKSAVIAGLDEYEKQKVIPISVRRLKIDKDDIVVIVCDRKLSPAECRSMQEIWAEKFPQVKAAVLDGGMDIAVLAREVFKDEPKFRMQ